MISTVLQSSGVVCGFFLIASVFVNSIKDILRGLDLYIFIAGIAVLYVSISGIIRDIFKNRT